VVSPAQQRREDYADEHGYDSYYELRTARDEYRENMALRGTELDAYEALSLMDFGANFDIDDMPSREALLDAWHDEFGYDRDDEFYDWLGELYG
jgi:hypothetical protein